jgi:S-adenosylmethionine:tRNA ribosyltransferase-isomerase
LKLSEFDYKLPHSLIAQHPLKDRDQSRLMILDRKTGEIEHKKFFEIVSYLTANDVLVLNDTKVIPARMYVKKVTGGKVELLLLKEIEALKYEILLGGAGKVKENDFLILPDGIKKCSLLEKLGDGKWLAHFDFDSKEEFDNYLDKYGITPTPPYIKRSNPLEQDKLRYQTIYAKTRGSCAAPTAGLHFTEELIKKIDDIGVKIVYLTLHVGFGTFKPIKCENVEDHVMDSEFIEISNQTANKLQEYKTMGKRIISVGTTSTRALETASRDGCIRPYQGGTSLFIYPGYKFKFVDSMITNFHLPDSTLILLVSAFAGKEIISNAYQEAILSGYRFYSYGDAMFVK